MADLLAVPVPQDAAEAILCSPGACIASCPMKHRNGEQLHGRVLLGSDGDWADPAETLFKHLLNHNRNVRS